jgi:hypothetical protein
VCFSDYFSGYPYPVIAIPVYGTLTNLMMASHIKEQVNWDYENLNYVYSQEDIKLFEEFAEELKQKPNEIFYEPDQEYMDMLEEDEDIEPDHIYMGLCKPVTKF